MVMKQLYINGVGTGQFGIFISSDTFLNSPEIAYEAYEVPGLDGSLLKYDKRLNNVARRFDCFCKSDVDNNIAQFKKLLYSNRGYVRIESDYDPEYYQMGYLAEGIEFTPFDQSGAYEVQFSVYFSCKPTKIYKTATPFTISGRRTGNINAIYSKTDPYMQTIFAQMPVEDIPEAEYFAVLNVTHGSFGGGTFDVAITSTEKTFLALYRGQKNNVNNPYVYTLEGYANNSDHLNVTGLEVERIYEIWETIVALHDDTIDTVFTNGTTTYTNQNILGTDGHGTVTKTTAMGANLQMSAAIRIADDDTDSVFVHICGFFQSNETFDALWEFDTPTARANGLDKVITDYGYTDSGYSGKRLEFVFDLETYDVYVTHETDRKNVTNYFVMLGKMEGFCDEIEISVYTTQDSPYFDSVTITPEWWSI